jgi:CheY-like chemotaxis protein
MCYDELQKCCHAKGNEMRIAYIEDNPANVALVERISNMNHDELYTFDDPDKALDFLAKQEFSIIDLILMDINLGDDRMNGLELTKTLRDRGFAQPIVIVTAYDAMGYPELFQTAGFNEYILKPVSVRNMIDLIDAYRP